MNVKPYKSLEMEKQDYLPYHQSLVKFFEIIEKIITNAPVEYRASSICRFRIESSVLLSHMEIVKIPEQEINGVAVKLLSFCKAFTIRYEDLRKEASSVCDEDELEIIGCYFLKAVDNLISRPSELPEIPELETVNWFDIPDDQSDETLGIRLAGQLLLNKGFPENQITTLCRKACWLMKNDGDIRSSAMEKVLEIECPKFFKEYGNLFIKAWTWPSELTESEFAEVKAN